MPRMNDPVIEGKYKVTRYTRVIPIVVEHEEDKTQWAQNKSIYTDSGEPDTLKESTIRPNGHLWKISDISEVNNFLSRKEWILIKKRIVKEKGRNPVPVN